MIKPLEQFERDIRALEAAIAVRPGFNQATNKLLVELELQNASRKDMGVFSATQILLNERIKGQKDWTKKLTKPSQLKTQYGYWIDLLKNTPAISPSPNNQMFAGGSLTINGVRAACPKYLSFFAKTEVIPSYCFDCYKVQILTKDAETLLRVYFLLRSISLPRKNTRKIMAETRVDIKNPYKGYIYCQNIEEAQEIKRIFDDAQKTYKIRGAVSKITHGCSEYSAKYPDFQYDSKNAHKTFDIPNWWVEHEERNTIKEAANFKPNELNDFISLRQVLSMNALVHYSKAIGDKSLADYDYVPVIRLKFLARLESQASQRRQELEALEEILK